MNDVLDLLTRKGIKFVLDGNDAKVVCLNPDHEDTNPSLRIDKTTGKYNCFSCGFRGESIFEHFNEYYNPIRRKAAELKDRIANILADSIGIELPDGIEFYLGDHRGIPPKLYKAYGVFQHPEYGEDRLCFPVRDVSGKITNIIARSMNTAIPPKYKMYPAGRSVPLFPPRAGRHIVLVEGIYDLLNLESKGVHNVVSIFGTVSLNYNNVLEKLTPYMLSGVQDVILLLDNDKAGLKAAEKLKNIIEIKTNLRVRVLNGVLPSGKDPGDLDKEEVDMLQIEIGKVLD